MADERRYEVDVIKMLNEAALSGSADAAAVYNFLGPKVAVTMPGLGEHQSSNETAAFLHLVIDYLPQENRAQLVRDLVEAVLQGDRWELSGGDELAMRAASVIWGSPTLEQLCGVLADASDRVRARRPGGGAVEDPASLGLVGDETLLWTFVGSAVSTLKVIEESAPRLSGALPLFQTLTWGRAVEARKSTLEEATRLILRLAIAALAPIARMIAVPMAVPSAPGGKPVDRPN